VQLPGSNGKPVPVAFHTVGRFINFPGFPQGIDLVGNLAFYRNATGAQRTDLFLVRTADPAPESVTRIGQALRASAGSANPVLVETTTTAINRDASSLTALNMRGLGNLEALFAVVMSAIGVGIFVFGLLLQRRKEFVTMRALGMGLGQLRALVLGEATIVAAFSLVIGGLVGAGMALMFTQVLRPLFTIPPAGLTVPIGELSLLATLVLGGVGISALIAARILRRLNPAELLREE
jgi:ABC-type antimicrobial peptide transport system permease subunit